MRPLTPLLAAMSLLSPGCFSAGYLAQAARGELQILYRARPIRQVVTDPAVPERVRLLLSSVPVVKSFGEANGLAPTGNYDRYADLGRPAVVWNVLGCAPLSFDVRHWRFPLVGTVPYLGFFRQEAARRYARELARAESLDVDVRGASAFSTLGWFRDPVLSTMIPAGDEALGELANVILHESVHATLYVNDQSPFDESLADFVADRLTEVWLRRVLGPEARETRAWLAAVALHRSVVARIHRAYLELDALYRSAATDERKRAEKARLLEALRVDLGWARPLNNASIAGFKTYDTGGPAFERLLSSCGGSWPRFLRALRGLEPSDFGEPQREEFDEVVDRLARRGCAP